MLSHFLRRCRPLSIAHSKISGRGISTGTAKCMLGLPENNNYKPTVRELRNAYFEAAKRCHPDVVKHSDDNNTFQKLDFRDITEAYEHLLSGDHIQCNKEEMDNIVSISEEEEYRQVCRAALGIPAEIVEESKQNPMFRQWLTGNTDAAHHWRAFFAAHGGLAQKLRPPAGYLGKGDKDEIVKKSETRRKRTPR